MTTKSQHTQESHFAGPWSFTPHTFSIKAIDHGNKVHIGFAYNPDFTVAANEANARVISAAPELLECLEAMYNEYYREEYDPDSVLGQAFRAITKAKG